MSSSKANSYHASAGQEFWLAFWNEVLPLKSSAQRAQDSWSQQGTVGSPQPIAVMSKEERSGGKTVLSHCCYMRNTSFLGAGTKRCKTIQTEKHFNSAFGIQTSYCWSQWLLQYQKHMVTGKLHWVVAIGKTFNKLLSSDTRRTETMASHSDSEAFCFQLAWTK